MAKLLHVTTTVPADIEAVTAYINGGLPGLNFVLMRRQASRVVPALGTTLRYVPEPHGSEEWQNAVELAQHGEGDCEDLASYEAARYRLQGEPATVAIVRTNANTLHAVVRRADGTIEDPARALRDRYAPQRHRPVRDRRSRR